MTIYSNVITGANGDGITKQIESELKAANYKMAGDITYSFSGEQEQQKKRFQFLVWRVAFGFSKYYDYHCLTI